MLDDYAFGLSLYTLLLREDASWRAPQRTTALETLVEADVLVAVHAPPERGVDAIRLLEHACEIVRRHPRLDALASAATAAVMLRPTTIEEMARLWQAPATPLQPAVICSLRVVSTRADDRPVAD